jgi:hypothetical protein
MVLAPHNHLHIADPFDVRAQSGLICAQRSMIAEESSAVQIGGDARLANTEA